MDERDSTRLNCEQSEPIENTQLRFKQITSVEPEDLHITL